MRDPARIEETLEALRAYWEANPDLRLAQILVNTATRAGVLESNLYNMEDEVLVRFLSSPSSGE